MADGTAIGGARPGAARTVRPADRPPARVLRRRPQPVLALAAPARITGWRGRAQAAVCAGWHDGHSPQDVTSASARTKAPASAGVRDGADPTTQSMSRAAPQERHTAWWWLSPTRVS